jgi:fructose-1,6-bisphosphatase/inositol monophosphatase family enzyme
VYNFEDEMEEDEVEGEKEDDDDILTEVDDEAERISLSNEQRRE